MCVPLTALRLYTKDSEKGRYKGVLAVLPIRDCFISPTYLFLSALLGFGLLNDIAINLLVSMSLETLLYIQGEEIKIAVFEVERNRDRKRVHTYQYFNISGIIMSLKVKCV